MQFQLRVHESEPPEGGARLDGCGPIGTLWVAGDLPPHLVAAGDFVADAACRLYTAHVPAEDVVWQLTPDRAGSVAVRRAATLDERAAWIVLEANRGSGVTVLRSGNDFVVVLLPAPPRAAVGGGALDSPLVGLHGWASAGETGVARYRRLLADRPDPTGVEQCAAMAQALGAVYLHNGRAPIPDGPAVVSARWNLDNAEEAFWVSADGRLALTELVGWLRRLTA